MLCIFQADDEDSAWVCQICHHRSRIRNGKPAPTRVCSRLRIVPLGSPCPMRAVVSRLTSAGVDRLQRCRAAECGLMHVVDGHTACVGMGGGKCGWVAKWSACLNGDQPFPNGANDCPHWDYRNSSPSITSDVHFQESPPMFSKTHV